MSTSEPRHVDRAIAGWGNFPVQPAHLYRPEKIGGVRDVVKNAADATLIPRGLGRSYGDAALNENGGVVLCERSRSDARLRCRVGRPARRGRRCAGGDHRCFPAARVVSAGHAGDEIRHARRRDCRRRTRQESPPRRVHQRVRRFDRVDGRARKCAPLLARRERRRVLGDCRRDGSHRRDPDRDAAPAARRVGVRHRRLPAGGKFRARDRAVRGRRRGLCLFRRVDRLLDGRRRRRDAGAVGPDAREPDDDLAARSGPRPIAAHPAAS